MSVVSRFPFRIQPLAAPILAGMLVSCGGGGGSPTPTPTPTSPPVATKPSFTSAATTSVTENESGTFYTATATDPQGDAITFAIQGGVDAGDFVLENGNSLRFDDPANFDLARDSDGDNDYQVILRATAGGESVDLNLTVRVTNDREGIAVTRIAEGFNDPVGLTMLYDGQKLLVAERSGKVAIVNGADGSITERTDISSALLAGDILSVAYGNHNTRFTEGVYFLINSPTEGLLIQNYDLENSNTAKKLFGATSSGFTAGKLFRGDKGQVLAAIGDPGGTRAQNDGSPFGKIWESREPCLYCGASVPPDPAVSFAVIADGIGDPGGGSGITGRVIFADRGQTEKDELNLFATDWRPLDFGWPFYEGYVEVSSSPPDIVNGPSLTLDRGNDARQANGIVAGAFYEGAIASIKGHYVFGDLKGAIWSIPLSVLNDGFRHTGKDFEVRTQDFKPDVGTIDSPVAIELAQGNVLYILDADGEIFRVDQAS